MGQSSKQSDIFSLGVLLNFLFTQKTPSACLYQGEEKQVILKATAIDPQERYRSVEVMKKALSKSHKEDSYLLPGFRGGSKTSQLMALGGYLLLIAASIASNEESLTIKEVYTGRIYMLLIILFTICLFGNYRNIKSRCLFYQKNNRMLRITGMVITWILIVFSSLVLFSMINLI